MSRVYDALRRGRTAAARPAASPIHHADTVLAALGYAAAKRRRGRSLVVTGAALVIAGATGWALWGLPSRIEARVAKGDERAARDEERRTPSEEPRARSVPQVAVTAGNVTTRMPAAMRPVPAPDAAISSTRSAPLPGQPPVPAPSEPEDMSSAAPVARRNAPLAPRASPLVSRPGRDDFQLALYYQRAGDFEQALLHYRAALRADEMNVEAHNNLGSLYLGRNLLDEAAREFQRVLAIDPTYVPAHVNLSAIHYTQGRFDAAAAQARGALRIDPRSVDGLVNLALAQKAGGQPGDARASLQRALELNPRHPAAHYNLARHYEETGEAVRAVEHFRLFLQYAGPEHEAHATDVRARLLTGQGRANK